MFCTEQHIYDVK